MHPRHPTLLGFFQQHERDLSSLALIVEQYQKISSNNICADLRGDFSVANGEIIQKYGFQKDLV